MSLGTLVKMGQDSAELPSFRLIGMRGMIADKMCDSLHTMAQLTYHEECLAQRVLTQRAELKAQGSSVSIEDLIIKAVSDTLRERPIFNSRVEGKDVFTLKQHHISIAVSLDQGLVAPTIFNVQDKTLAEISVARKDLIARARIGKLTVPEMTGGTFTISNLGLRRVHYFTPIINSPQVAILGIGHIVKRPWVEETTGDITVAPVMGLSLTTDHRVVDGDPSGEFLGLLCDRLEYG